jgi:hypothetical protein
MLFYDPGAILHDKKINLTSKIFMVEGRNFLRAAREMPKNKFFIFIL